MQCRKTRAVTGANFPPPPSKPARKRPLISLTPLIDVVFILLIFFMLASSFLDWRAIDLDAPVQASGAAASGDGALLIEIEPDGLRLGAEPVTLDALAGRVGERLSVKPDRRVLIKPSEGVPLQRTVDVLDRMEAIGVADMSLIRDGGG